MLLFIVSWSFAYDEKSWKSALEIFISTKQECEISKA